LSGTAPSNFWRGIRDVRSGNMHEFLEEKTRPCGAKRLMRMSKLTTRKGGPAPLVTVARLKGRPA
jgi:hypothetical protein